MFLSLNQSPTYCKAQSNNLASNNGNVSCDETLTIRHIERTLRQATNYPMIRRVGKIVKISRAQCNVRQTTE